MELFRPEEKTSADVSDKVKSVLVCMSGGVDSSVAAALLVEQGYSVSGVTFTMLPDGNTATNTDAKAVCDFLGIQFNSFDLTKPFREHVINNFIMEYNSGRTPNPCVRCNRFVKFMYAADLASDIGVEYVATGHYSGVTVYPVTGRYILTKSIAGKKDQTYFLYSLTQEQLKRIIFPLSGYTKEDVRLLAKKFGLPTAKKPDSQEICFVPGNDYGEFLTSCGCISPSHGNYVSAVDGEILGNHKGLCFYTVGQRKGLGVAKGKPLYVISMDSDRNEIILGEDNDLYKSELVISDVNIQAYDTIDRELEVSVKIRNQAPAAPARIFPYTDGKYKIIFAEPQRAITPGQSAVFYIGDALIGGGVIC